MENIVIVIGLVTVTFFEYRVHRYFKENNPAAPSLGFRNQALFAAAILIYCIYHAFTPLQFSPEDMNLLQQNGMIDPNSVKQLVKVFYALVALFAGGSQFGVACYYRSAEVRSET